MAKKTSLEHIESTVKEYANLLRADGIDIKKILLYGSYAKRKQKKDSDIDSCIISDRFGKNPTEEGKYFFRKLWLMKNANIEPIGYSPNYFYNENNWSPLIDEIKKTGIELKV
ncbi:MAG: nucleotidyltransferase domain-containing protein [Parcubacteria group bacterium]|nr:nucleotidyltransferase domain-containing protein [Parcubacteria group bacterium]